jgi:nitronate monooxygenase
MMSIMAPMFLVSNTKMVIEGMKSGVGCIPALNYHRTLEAARFHFRTGAAKVRR